MLNYIWDFGFNWDAVLNSDGKTYFLETGLVAFPQNQVASSGLALPLNSVFGFHLFNISNVESAGAGQNCIITLTMNFRANANGQTATSPFNDSNNNFLNELAPTMAVVAPGGSTIMGPGPFPCWYAGPYTAVNAGQFKFTVTVDVQISDGNGGTIKKTFTDDPEMIIGSAG